MYHRRMVNGPLHSRRRNSSRNYRPWPIIAAPFRRSSCARGSRPWLHHARNGRRTRRQRIERRGQTAGNERAAAGRAAAAHLAAAGRPAARRAAKLHQHPAAPRTKCPSSAAAMSEAASAVVAGRLPVRCGFAKLIIAQPETHAITLAELLSATMPPKFWPCGETARSSRLAGVSRIAAGGSHGPAAPRAHRHRRRPRARAARHARRHRLAGPSASRHESVARRNQPGDRAGRKPASAPASSAHLQKRKMLICARRIRVDSAAGRIKIMPAWRAV